MKLFSIITINFNDVNGLRKTIESVTSQKFESFEYIIIDGGSTDGSLEVIKEYDSLIDHWISEPDNGIYPAMNKGIRFAHGKYLNFMNSGDIFHGEDVLNKVYAEITNEDIVIGNCYIANTNHPYSHLRQSQYVTMMTLMKEIINHQSTFYNRTIFEKHLYDEQLKIIADWKLNLQSIIFDNCKVKIINVFIADYDLSGISTTNSILFQQERKKVLDELIPKRIQQDYERLYTDEELPIVTLLPQLKESWRLQRFVYRFTKWLLKFRK